MVRGAGFEPAWIYRGAPGALRLPIPPATHLVSPASIDLARPKAAPFEDAASAFRHGDIVETLQRQCHSIVWCERGDSNSQSYAV
jgi:hypothetical protein